MEIYVIRHGETVWNVKGITQGWSNNRLSKRGIEQVTSASEKLKNENFNLIITSPLMRTVQTSNIINSHHKAKIIKDSRVIEVNQGIFTGRKFSQLSDEEKRKKATRSSEFGMENFESVEKRVQEFLAYIKSNFFDKKILVVTHDFVASCIEAIIQGKKFDEAFFNQTKYKYAEFKKIEI